uniref:Sushi domain-containing protein n=1 Tax=Varanus komodoensis TaxID=61221 RepID=A0A8D2L789_VARKO
MKKSAISNPAPSRHARLQTPSSTVSMLGGHSAWEVFIYLFKTFLDRPLPWSQDALMCPVTAVICPALHKPDHGRFSCLHPHGNFAYGSSCNFSCSGGFQLLENTQCIRWPSTCPARSAHTSSAVRFLPKMSVYCERQCLCFPLPAVRCPALEDPAHGRSACSHPYGHFAYRSSCVFSCRSGFELLGPEMLNCTDQGNWTGAAPTCEATRCPGLLAPLNGHMNCTHPHGDFSFDSGCSFSCDVGFSRVGPEMLQCTPLGEWTKTVPTCEGQGRSALGGPNPGRANMKLRCSSPWAPFSYGSACEFSCPEGYVLNGTKQMQCQADGSWSAAMPLCQGTPVGFQCKAGLSGEFVP